MENLQVGTVKQTEAKQIANEKSLTPPKNKHYKTKLTISF